MPAVSWGVIAFAVLFAAVGVPSVVLAQAPNAVTADL